MRKSFVALFAVAVISVAGVAQAAPAIFVNTLTGNINVLNDTPNSIVNIKSAAGWLAAPTYPKGTLAAPGSVDLGDLPNFIALLNTPNTMALNPDPVTSVGKGFKLGDGSALVAGKQLSELQADITLEWYTAFGQPAQVGQTTFGVPEPTTIAMAGLGMIGMIAAIRRRA